MAVYLMTKHGRRGGVRREATSAARTTDMLYGGGKTQASVSGFAFNGFVGSLQESVQRQRTCTRTAGT